MDITLHKSTLRDARKGVKSVKPSSTAVLQYIAVDGSVADSAVSAGGGKEAIKASSVGDPSQAAQARSATPV